MRYGTVLQVNDLNLCRCFYRDTLNLGEPEIDSTELTVFRLCSEGEVFLVLQKNPLPCLEHASSAASWFMKLPGAAGIAEKLKSAGYPVCTADFYGGEFYRISDPEGNTFFISE